MTTDDAGTADRLATPRRRVLKGALRVAIGVAAFTFLLWRSDVNAIVRAMGDASLGLILGALALVFGVLVVGAFRWQQFLRPLGLALRPPTLLRMYFVGTFFNAFLPTGVGGDAYKAIRLGRVAGSMATAFASVFLDRISGLTGLALLGLPAAAVRILEGDHSAVVVVAGALSLGILLAAVIIVGFGDRLIGRPDTPLGRWGIRHKMGRTLAAMSKAGRDPRAAALGQAGGVLTQAFLVGIQVLLANALGFSIGTAALTNVLVVATVASAIPLSINGLGFREGSYVWALGVYGIGHNLALAFALLMLAILLVASAVGGVVYVVAGGEVAVTRQGHGTARTAAIDRTTGR